MKFTKRLFLLALTPVLVLTATVPAVAQNNTVGSGLSISPLHHRLNIDPGQTSTITLTLKNITNGPIIAKPYVNDFKSDNVTGNAVIVTNPKEKLSSSIRDFVPDLQNVPLAVGEKKTVTISVQVPKDVSPGAHYGIIRYQAIPANRQNPDEGQVALSASVGAIVFVQIKGDLVERLQLLGIKTYRGNDDGSFFLRKPNKVGVEIRNLGNAFSEPFGKVVLTDMSGKQLDSYELNNVNPRSTVLPGTKRTFTHELKQVTKPGRYKLSASVAYGNGSDVLVSQKTFWYIPAWILAIVAVVLLTLLVATYLAYRRYAHHKKRNKKLRR